MDTPCILHLFQALRVASAEMKQFLCVFAAVVVVACTLVPSAMAYKNLGTVGTPVTVKCTGLGFMSGANCQQITVTCPGCATIAPTYAVRNPSNPAAGTIILHGGGGGTGALDQGFVNKYATNYQLIQVIWPTDWENTGGSNPKSIKIAACRTATLFRYLKTHAHDQAYPGTPFCYQGQSGGSGVGAYNLAHYDMETEFDAVVLTAGPVFGRIDQGCMIPSAPLVTVCPAGNYGCTHAPYQGSAAYGDGTNCGTTSGMGLWTGAPCNCQTGGNTSPAQNQAWWDMSVVSTGADYAYPQTAVSMWGCDLSAATDNNSFEQGQFYASQITAANVPIFKQDPLANCAGAETVPNGVDLTTGDSGLISISNWMISQCVLRH